MVQRGKEGAKVLVQKGKEGTRFVALTYGKVSKDSKTGTNTNMLLGCLFFVATDCA